MFPISRRSETGISVPERKDGTEEMKEPLREKTFDVIVAGAGTAGAAAASAAADCGARVLAVEQFGSAGGSGTLGLVTPMMSTGIRGNPQCSYVGREILGRLQRENAGDGQTFELSNG